MGQYFTVVDRAAAQDGQPPVARGAVYGKSDATGSSPAENPVHPVQLLATVYHAMGIDPKTLVYNHLNQPRELVQAEPVLGLVG